MKKTEKYKSFHEMKESSTSITPANAALVMERHEQIKQSLVSMRKDFIKHKSSSENKPVNRN
jgi:hypothetical protein